MIASFQLLLFCFLLFPIFLVTVIRTAVYDLNGTRTYVIDRDGNGNPNVGIFPL